MNMLEVYVPVATSRVAHLPLAPRLPELEGRRIGWLDNMKANAGDLLQATAATMAHRGHEFTVVTAQKNATTAAPESVMAHLRTCDAVVLAIAD